MVGACDICLISRDNLGVKIFVIIFNSEDVDTGGSVGTLRVKGRQSALCAKSEKEDIASVESEVLIQFVSWGAKINLDLISTAILHEGPHMKLRCLSRSTLARTSEGRALDLYHHIKRLQEGNRLPLFAVDLAHSHRIFCLT